MNDIVTQDPRELQEQQAGGQSTGFERQRAAVPQSNLGSVDIEKARAIAEAEGQLILAKKFPRNMTQAVSDFLDACSVPAFAATAFYAVKNRGSGPSIRFAEECARCFGNFEYGHREIGRNHDSSEIEVYAWDKQANNRSIRQITVKHIVDTKEGPRKLRDQADIDNRIANVASKQMRGRILALLPKYMVALGIERAKATIAGDTTQPLSQRVLGVVEAFKKYGVGVTHIETYLGHQVADVTLDEFTELIGIGNALKDGAKPSEYFELSTAKSDAAAATAAITAAAAAAPAQAAQQQPQGASQQDTSSRRSTTGGTARGQSTGMKAGSNKASAKPTAPAPQESGGNIDQQTEPPFDNDTPPDHGRDDDDGRPQEGDVF